MPASLRRSLFATMSALLLAACGDDPVMAPELRPGDPSFNIDVTTGSLTLELRYGGQSLAEAGVSTSGGYCLFHIYMDPTPTNSYGQHVRSLCGSSDLTQPVTITGLPTGDHTFQLRYLGAPPTQSSPQAVVASAAVTLAAGQTASQVLDVGATMGLVSSKLTVNEEVPAPNQYLVCSATFQSQYPCLHPDATTGAFRFLELPGVRASVVRSVANNVVLATINYTVTAGELTEADLIAVQTGDVSVELQYNGGPLLQGSGVTINYQCPLTVYIDPSPPSNVYGQRVTDLCGSTSIVRGLPAGEHTLQIRFNGPPATQGSPQALLATASLSIAKGQTTTKGFDMSGTLGVVSGTVTVKGQAPPQNEYIVCPATFDYGYPCVRPGSTGAFRYFDIPGTRVGAVRPVSSSSIGTPFEYTVTAGQTIDVGTVAGDQVSMKVEIRYDGKTLSELGIASGGFCPLLLYRDPTPSNYYGQYVRNLCGPDATAPVTVTGLPTGQHTFQVLFQGPPLTITSPLAVVASAAVTLSPDHAVTQVFDLTPKMGLVSGTLTVNGTIPAAGQYYVCTMHVTSRSGYPCVGTEAGTGLFSYLDLPGARSGMVRGNQSGVAISDFGYTVTAGQTTLVGTTTGGSSGNTSTGASVEVEPVDSRNNNSPVTLVFGNVTTSGQTTLSSGGTGPTLPKGKKGGNPLIYYNIATTATFQNVKLCINYSESDFKNPSTLQLFHYENGTWVDVTDTHDPVAKVICSKPMSSLSPFVVTEADAQAPVAHISVSSAEAAEGSAITFDGGSSSDDDGTITLYEWDWNNDGTYDETGKTLDHTFLHSGSRTVGLKVTDNDGSSHATTTTVTITNVAPTVTVGTDQSTFKRTAVTLSASFTDPGADDGWAYTVDWGDGTVDNDAANTLNAPGNLPSLAHEYSSSVNSPFTVTVTVSDKDGGSHSGTFKVTVTNRKPQIASMGGPYSVVEGGSVSFGPTATDPDGDPLSYVWSFSDGGTASGAAPSHRYADDTGQPFTATVTVTDNESAAAVSSVSVTVQNARPVLGAISGLPAGPIPAGTAVTLSASFTDPGSADTHTGTVTWDVGSTQQSATITSGTVSATRVLSVGVYTVSLSVTDDDGGVGTASGTSYIVVYDPSGGFVTGGGWILSPTNAYAADRTLTGKASFGFIAKYQKGTTTPSGNTEFEFTAGSLRFKATSYSWLVVAGSQAKYKGEGTINGAGRYGFMLTAVDGDVESRGSSDAFRIKIWDMASGAIVYDNQMGEGDDSDASTTLGGGSIVIHR